MMATMMDTFRSFFDAFRDGDETATDVLWKVDNFSFCHLLKGEKMTSPVFSLGGDSACFFELYPRGKIQIGSALDVRLLKQRANSRTPKVLLFGIASAKNVVWEALEIKDYDAIETASLTVKGEACQNAAELTLDDTLTIRCVLKHPVGRDFKPKNILLRSSFAVKSFSSTLEIPKTNGKKYLPQFDILGDVFSSHLTTCSDSAIRVHINPIKLCKNYYVTCKVVVIDSEGIPLSLLQKGHFFLKSSVEEWVSDHPFNTAFFSANKQLYFPEDTLSCVVEITCTNEVSTSGEIRYGHKSFICKDKDSPLLPGCLGSDLRQLLEDDTSYDVNLKIDSDSIPVHKSILRARSPVFKAMMCHDTVENATNTVTIPDMDLETLRHVVQFMYTDTVKELDWNNALLLYYAADKYDISLLKRKCAEYLVGNINEGNIYEVLVLSDMHNDDFLKTRAQNFILSQKSTVVKSENWKSIEKNYPKLAIGILRELYCKAVVTEERVEDDFVDEYYKVEKNSRRGRL